jgi:hypothetical protein
MKQASIKSKSGLRKTIPQTAIRIQMISQPAMQIALHPNLDDSLALIQYKTNKRVLPNPSTSADIPFCIFHRWQL